MLNLQKGRYRARVAETKADQIAAQELRAMAFRGMAGRDVDPFDADCDHVLVEEAQTGTLVCCFRLMYLPDGTGITRSYSAQFYDLSALEAFDGPLVEMGRFCIHPDHRDPDILRVAWGAMTAYVDREGIEMLFGCSSFPGTDARIYEHVFALLRDRHQAPAHWQPKIKAPLVVPFADDLPRVPDARAAQARMPSLLKTYLVMGGWVSDHAVVDPDLGTLHVFTGVEIRAVPPARARLLRGMAG